MKMIITNSLVFQAIGIVLEAAGLLSAFGSFGSVRNRWSQAWRNQQFAPSSDALREKGLQYTIQSWLIGGGLLLQLIGLFV